MTLSTGALRRLLRALEAPDCDCPLVLSCPCGEACQGAEALICGHCQGECDCPPLPVQQPCHHQIGADHQTPLATWAALLWSAHPEDYRDPPPPAGPALVLTRQARIDAMAARHAAGLGLYHALDAWRASELKVGAASRRYCGCAEFRARGECSCARGAGRLRNGATDPTEALVIRSSDLGGA